MSGSRNHLEAQLGLEVSTPFSLRGLSKDMGFLYNNIGVGSESNMCASFPGTRRQTAHCVKKGHGIVKATFCNPETQPSGRQKKCYEKDCPPR